MSDEPSQKYENTNTEKIFAAIENKKITALLRRVGNGHSAYVKWELMSTDNDKVIDSEKCKARESVDKGAGRILKRLQKDGLVDA